MKSKKIIAILAAMAMMLSTAACGSSSKDEEDLDDLTEEEANELLEEYEEEENDDDDEDEEEEDDSGKIDPFEGLEVTFSGTAPYSSVVLLDGENSNVEYTVTPTGNIQNGDTVTITAELSSTAGGTELTESEKEYTVEGLDSYITSIDEIPAETYDKMAAQADDGIAADAAGWVEGNSIVSSDLLGAYLLTEKVDGVKTYMGDHTYNTIYLVYKVTTNVTGLKRGTDGSAEETGTETYYTYYCFRNIINLADGTCSVDLSDGYLCYETCESDYGNVDMWSDYSFYTYNGYSDLDSMFNDCVTAEIEDYEYESTVTE